MAWRIEVTETAKKRLAKLDRQIQDDIVRYLRERIDGDEDPRRCGGSWPVAGSTGSATTG